MRSFKKSIAFLLLLLVLMPGWLRDIHFLFFHDENIHFPSLTGWWEKNPIECPYLFLEYFLVSAVEIQGTNVWLPALALNFNQSLWSYQRLTIFRLFLKRAPPADFEKQMKNQYLIN